MGFAKGSNKDVRDQETAEELAEQIISNHSSNESNGNTKSNPSSNNEVVLAHALETTKEEVERLKEEQKMLRALASSGIVLASFSHDLSKLKDRLNSRSKKLMSVLTSSLDEDNFDNVTNLKNPFYLLTRMQKDDQKLETWLGFALGATKKDKRRRKNIKLQSYFLNYKQDWSGILNSRKISFKTDKVDDVDFRVFEVDLDSIFNNLLSNSIESFNMLKIDRNRVIEIMATESEKELIIEYRDSGCGLSPDIENSNSIFEPLFTTKRNEYTGEEIGTGLGMWIVKSVIQENDGKVRLLFPKHGFGLRMVFPKKYDRKK